MDSIMDYSNQAADIAKSLASAEWIWSRQSIEATVSRFGWTRSGAVGHRTTYSCAGRPCVSIYFDRDRPELVEVGIKHFANVELLNEVEYEDKVDEFYDAFSRLTDQLRKVLGQPSFSNGAAATGFPVDQDAVWLTTWKLPSARLMLQQKHEDRDLPFRVCIVVAPKIS